MLVKLIAHNQLSKSFREELSELAFGFVDSQAIALTSVRTCYSPSKPSEIVPKEGAKYFGTKATDGRGGNEADRLMRHIFASKHLSVTEHITYTFAIEGVSRSLLAQLTRHRQFSFSVQSQRYVKFGSGDKSGGFDYVTPPSLYERGVPSVESEGATVTATKIYESAMDLLQSTYDNLRLAGVPAEDARYVLPNAAVCNLVMTGNLRAFLEFYGKRKAGNGAQWEIADLAERFREEITKVDEWVAPFFNQSKGDE